MPIVGPKTKWVLIRILPFGIIWLIVGWIFLATEYAATIEQGAIPSTAIRINATIVLFASIAVFVIGILVGLIEVRYLEKKFIKQSFAKKLVYKILIYAALFSLMIFITFPVAASLELKIGIFDIEVWRKYVEFLGSITHFSTLSQMTISLVVSLFYSEVRDHIGHGVLENFFTGKHHQPSEYSYVFMFIDMRSSTTIAEKLGHIRYFRLLREYYADLSAGVIKYGGSIYQYVGDEMVVTWPVEDGIRNTNCLKCFFKMTEDIRIRAPRYEQLFGLVPEFKAGIHCGQVTVGEIGVAKKEILITGDVLNATSRIQGLCNSHGVDLLISDDLKQLMTWENDYSVTSIGEIALKGRKRPIKLWTAIQP